MTQTPGRGVVYIVDDDDAVRGSLTYLVESVGLHARAFETIAQFSASYDPSEAGCLVLDIRLPGESGMNWLLRKEAALPVVMLTGYADTQTAVRAMKAGAVDFIEKPFNDQVLIDQLHSWLEQDAARLARECGQREIRSRMASLTPRERDVLALVVAGKPNKLIARELDISAKTVEVHRARVMEKLGARSVAELVRISLTCD